MTLAEVRDVVREAIRTKGEVTARGFGTYGGDVPDGVRVVDMRGMDRVVEYDPADLTVTVEAGCRVDVLDAALGEHGQWLPVHVPWPEKTTVGGMIAAAVASPLGQGLGTLRDQVIGLEWVGGEAQVLRSGGRVVKNVAGYDLMKMHVGARGRFGVLTKATFRVRPRPAAGTTVTRPAPRPSGDGGVRDHVALRLRDQVSEALDPGGVFGYRG